MAYNSSKGPRHFGDINYEGDPSETQIDFDNDFIALRTNGVQRFAISGSKIEITGALLRDAANAYDIGLISSPWATVYANASVHTAAGTYSTMSTTGSITSGSAGSTRIGPGYITHSGSSYHTVSTSGSWVSGACGSISSSYCATTWSGSSYHTVSTSGSMSSGSEGSISSSHGTTTWTTSAGSYTVSSAGPLLTGSAGSTSGSAGTTTYSGSHTYTTTSTTGSITSGSAGSTETGPGYTTHSGSSYHTVSTSGSMSSGSCGSISSSLCVTTWSGQGQGTTGINSIIELSGGYVSASNGVTAHSITGSHLKLGGTAVTSTGAELNLLDGAGAGTVVNSKTVIYGAAGQVNGTSLSASAGITGSSIVIGAAGTTGATITNTGVILGQQLLGTTKVSSSQGITGSSLQIGGYGLTNDGKLAIASFNANWTNAGRTVADLGTVTTTDINGGTIDGAAIGAASQSTAKFTTISGTIAQVTTLTGSNISASAHVSASYFYGDGSKLSNLPTTGISWDGSTANGVATYKDGDEATVEANLTFDGDTLTATNASNNAIPAITIDRNYTGTTSIGNYTTDPQGLLIDYDVTGIVASGQTAIHDALAIHFNQDSPTHVGTLESTGIDCKMVGGTSGTQSMKGVAINLAGADNNTGIDITVPNDGTHLVARSPDSLLDQFKISVGVAGATTLSTNDADAAVANLTLDADGKIIIEAAAGDEVVFNEGDADVDFRVETADETHMLFVEGSSNRMSIGDSTDSPAATLEVTNASDGGVPLLQLNSNDTDKIAVDINAANVDANVLDITADAVTTAKAINVSADGLTTGNAIRVGDDSSNTGTRSTALIVQNNAAAINATGLHVQSDGGKKGISIDKNYSDTTEASIVGLDIDWDKTGASTSDNTMYGIQLDMDNTTATNGTNFMYGLHVTPTLTHAANAGSSFVYGALINAQGGTNGTSFVQAARFEAGGGDINYGIQLDIEDGGVDLRIESSADSGDYFQIQTTTHGATTITTQDDDATAAHLTFNVDGNITLDPVGGDVVLDGHLSSSGPVSGSELFGLGTGIKFPIRTATATYTASITDYTILANTSGGGFTVRIPSASIAMEKVYNIKKIHASGTLTILSDNGTIDGDASRSVTSLYESITVHSNGTAWYII